MNEYWTKKRQHDYRLQDREGLEDQILPLLVALDQEVLCEFMEVLENNFPNCTPIRSSVVNGDNSCTLKSEDHHQLREHHDDKRMCVHPEFINLYSEDKCS